MEPKKKWERSSRLHMICISSNKELDTLLPSLHFTTLVDN